ncbi:hypothetical protein [Timonella sp. A28]|uniref:hypothetical protein n=1 Tax=Timonella sp. A28 TaxID=3442640 RepID=UPI003EBD8B1D
MASTIKHTIEISNNNHTPSKPSQTNQPNPSGATSQAYTIRPANPNPHHCDLDHTNKPKNAHSQGKTNTTKPTNNRSHSPTRRADKRKHYPPTPTKIKPTPRDRNHTQNCY